MDRYAYYVCFKCGKAYFGGEARCDLEAGGGDTFNPEELVCGGCSDVSQVGTSLTREQRCAGNNDVVMFAGPDVPQARH